MLAAPTAPDDRLPAVCARARGFVYAVGLLGVTVDDRWGGSGLDAVAAVIAHEELSASDPGLHDA